MRIAILLAALAAFSLPASAQVVVTDGDTLKLDRTIFRLWGIDAPENRQICADGWPAGIEAKAALARILHGKPVDCEVRGRDRYGRTIGLCRAGGQDIQEIMVRSGMAWAFTRYSSDYVTEERAAIDARLGIHAHQCEKAWDWRAQKR